MNAAAPAAPVIADLHAGHEIVARIPLANPLLAAAEIEILLDALAHSPPDQDSRFQLLEHLRIATNFVCDELDKRYLNRPLPLDETEEGLFQKVVSLWLKTKKAYAQCALETSRTEPSPPVLRLATLLQRCIHYGGMLIVAHQRARREIPRGIWLELHGYYASAEELGVARLPLPGVSSITASYISFLLCDMAGCYSLPLRDQLLLQAWAPDWASSQVSLHRAGAGETLPAFVIDLLYDGALRPVAECLQTDQIRRLDTAPLAAQLRQLRKRLRQKTPPEHLGLGGNCTSGHCLRLLEYLDRPWSQARGARRFRRHPTSGQARLCSGFEEMHYFVSGREFAQPDSAHAYNRQEYETLFAFRHQVDPQQVLQIRQRQIGFDTDTWEVVNQSANGFRLMRSLSGRKMLHGQLLALCPHDSERFLLARITWLMQEKGGGLIAGIQALPGIPTATAARVLEVGSEWGNKYQRAFLLPALASIGEAPSLVLPPGWYRNGRLVEIYTDAPQRLRLTQLLEDGPDFERVNFATA